MSEENVKTETELAAKAEKAAAAKAARAAKKGRPVFDIDEPFGRVYGCLGPQFYSQGGNYFDSKGNLVDPIE